MSSALKGKKPVLQQLAQQLNRCPLPNEETADLRERFVAQLSEYSAQYAKFEEMCKEDEDGACCPPINSVLQKPDDDPTEVAAMFLKWRSSFTGDIANLDDRLPKLRLAAERMHNEVEEALTPGHDQDVLREILHEFFVRRADTLRCHRSMLQMRLRTCHRAVSSEASPVQLSSRVPLRDARWKDAVDASGRTLEQELQMIERRLQKLRPGATAVPNLRDISWSGGLLAVIRQQMSEDVATQMLRHFLCRLQYVGFTNRTKIWRRALELRAVTEIPTLGESPDSPLCRPCRVPTALRSRSHLESALEELGPIFGCSVSLKMDRGRSFAHQIAIDFASHFDKQQKRMSFRLCPIPARTAESGDASRDAKHKGSIVDAPSEREHNAEAYYLRPSDWLEKIPFRAREDPNVLEQGLLLKASHASNHTPARLVHGNSSYARHLLDNVVGNSKTKDNLQWEGDVDSVLRAEKAFLEVGDVKMVLRRLNDSGRRTNQPEETSESVAMQDAEDQARLPQPLLRAYSLIRHLQCRAQRCKLLDLLNFFRFVQRRLAAGVEEEHAALYPQASGSGTGHAKAHHELSPRTLTKMTQTCNLASITGEMESGIESASMERESLLLLGDEVAVVGEDGLKIIHEVALDDLKSLEREMLSIGSYFIHKYEASAGGTNIEKIAADRVGVLLDLYTSEVWFNSEKRRLLEIYLEIYEHTVDVLEKRDLAQRMIDVMVVRPRLDFTEDYFTDTYAVSISVFEARVALLRQLVTHQIQSEKMFAKSSPDVRQKHNGMGMTSQKSEKSNAEAIEGGSLPSQRFSRRSMRDSETQSNSSEPSSEDEDDGSIPPKNSLAHPLEGYRCCANFDAPNIALLPTAEPVAIDDFCASVTLAWKAELLIEEVHRDLVDQFRPSSGQLSSLLERACYMVAIETWRKSEDEKIRSNQSISPHNDADLVLMILKEAAPKVAHSNVRKDEEDEELRQPTPLLEIGGLDIDVHLTNAYSDLRRKCGNEPQIMLMHMMANWLDHVLLRRRLSSVTIEVACLESAIIIQHAAFSSRLETVRPSVLVPKEFEKLAKAGNAWIDRASPIFAAGTYESDLGYLDLTFARDLAIQAAPVKLQELRHLLQHELAYRNFVLTCVQHNAVLVDPTMRSKEMADVNLVGPSRDLMPGPGQVADQGAAVMRRLRQTASLAGIRSDRNATSKKNQSRTKGPETTQIFQDLSRYTHFLQTPMNILEPIRAAVLKIFNQRSYDLRTAGLGVSETDKQIRLLWFRLLTCCSLVMVRSACDLSVRVQAAEASGAFRAVAALIPSKLSPFDRLNDRKRQLIERDGSVGSVFAIPSVLEVLQLRGVQPDPDIEATMDEILSVLMPQAKGDQSALQPGRRTSLLPSRRLSVWGNVHDTTEKTKKDDGDDHRLDRVVPRLAIEYDGPSFTTLQMLHELTNLVTLHYTLATIDGDPLTLIRMQRFVRFNFMELDGTQDAVGNTLSRTEPTFESIEELRSGLSQLAHRLDGLEDGAHDAEKVLRVLHSEVRSAFRELLLLFRLSAQSCLEQDEARDHFAIFRRWTSFLEHSPRPADSCALGLGIRVPETSKPGTYIPSASLAIFSSVESREASSEYFGTSKRQCNLGRYSNCQGSRSEPEITTLQSDWKRYVSEIHPEMYPKHSLLSSFMRSMLSSHIAHEANSDYCEGAFREAHGTIHGDALPIAPLPAFSRVPWYNPAPSLTPLVSALCVLPVSRRHTVSALRLKLNERRVAFHKLHAIPRHTDRAAEADAEFFGTLAVLDILREHVVLGQLGVQLPDSSETFQRFRKHLTAHFAATRSDLQQQALDGDGKLQHGRVAQRMPLLSLTERSVHEGEEPTADEVRVEITAALAEIGMLATAFDKFLLATACERLGREFGTLAEYRHRLSASHSAKFVTQSLRERLAARGGSLYASKLDGVLHSLNQLRAAGTYVFSPGIDERAYVFREHDLNTCVEDLMRSMKNWGDDIVNSRDRMVNDMQGYLEFRYHALVQELYRNNAQYDEKDREETLVQRDAKVKGEVADQSCKLVFEVDRLHRVIRDLRTVSKELDYRLSSEIWNKVHESVGTLTSKLNAEIGLFRESHEDRAAGAARQMRRLREHIAGQLAEISSENYAAQQRAMQPRVKDSFAGSPETSRWDEEDKEDDRASSGIGDTSQKDAEIEAKKVLVVSDGMHKKFRDVARKDDNRLLLYEVAELKNRQILSRVFHHLKTQAMRQRFEEKMQALQMTLASNKELWDRLGNAAAGEAHIEREFAGTAQQMSLAELRIEELKSTLEANTDHREKLQGWRKNKARQVAHLEEKVRGHQRLGAVNVESLLQELQEKEELVQLLRKKRQDEDKAAKQAQHQADNVKQNLKFDLKLKRQLKDAAQKRLQHVRAQVESGGLSNDDRLRLWHSRIDDIKRRLAEAEKENQKLESISRSLPSLGQEESEDSDEEW